ncbi:GNAT family N-acetyltransferase [Dyella sp. KULCS107]|uniref:GNAT family N-acetyltransferase n=1 Tax=Dyella sp. KULCS107 TaxID=3422216 RepID=UPI003D6FE806
MEAFHVVEVEGRMVGTGTRNPLSEQPDAVFALPECMGRGIGRELMNHSARQGIPRAVHLEANFNTSPAWNR